MNAENQVREEAPFGLALEAWNALLDGLARREYHLLLGAGSSIGCIGGDSQPLTAASNLSTELLVAFAEDLSGTSMTLPQAYEITVSRAESKQPVHSFFQARFSNCSVTWQGLLTRIAWRRIWTLNIDDVVEQAYALSASPSQEPTSLLWCDPFREPRPDLREVQVVHLHGYAPALEAAPDSIVFSIVEYVRATGQARSWHRIFGDQYVEDPFLIVGARMTDEIDLAEIVRRGNASAKLLGKPSFIVLPHPTAAEEELFRLWGLTLVKSTGEEFFERVIADLPAAEARIAAVVSRAGVQGAGPEVRVFLHQFQWLRLDSLPSLGSHDFYAGEDPEWHDILLDLDAALDVEGDIMASLAPFFADDRKDALQQIGCISGPPGCGKTTALLRLGKALISKGYDVFLFRGEERLDVESTLWWLKESKQTAILVDGLKDHGPQIGELALRCRQQGVDLLVLSTERDSRIPHLYADILPAFLKTEYPYRMTVLSGADISRLVAKLRANARLGFLTRAEDGEIMSHFRKHAGRQLIVGMMELNQGPGFEQRLLDEFAKDVAAPELRDAYGLACLSYRYGYELPVGIACAAAGIDVLELTKALEQPGGLLGVLRVGQIGLRPRHRVIASRIVSRALSTKDRFRLMLVLAQALAPHISRNTISLRTIPARIGRHLFDANVVLDMLGGHEASDWFSKLQDLYGWNSRYWEQRALTELSLGHFAKARDWAEEAVRIQDHSFTRTTLATVLMKMAFEHFTPGSPEALNVFWQSVGHLEKARDGSSQPSEHEYTTFFSYALKLAELKDLPEDMLAKLRRKWLEWMKDAEQNPAFQHLETAHALGEFNVRWIRATAVTKP